ncbi:MAG TPA: ATP-binding cassette domain-containing protein [Caulobacteraceae bacterium]|nr:ATP-binding cassette domain-containing protein [Caulobacteraceae bacterium]
MVFDDVVVRFDGGEPVLAGVSFALAPGSFHFVTGASGSGKTTVLKLIAMAERPSSGRIRLFGRDVTAIGKAERAPLRRRLGVVFQEFGLQDHLTAFDNVALACRAAGRRWRDYRAEVAELLGWVGLGGRMAALPAALSAGERQRLALARAVINRPELLIADEPTGAVDNALALRLLRLFTDLNKVGVTVLIASHDEDLVARSGAPRLHLSDGRLTAFPAPTREVGA